jgi:hypothetical protein
MATFSFKMSKDLWNSLGVGDILTDTVTRIVWTIVDVERRYDLGRRVVYKVYNRSGDSLTFYQCLEYHYNKEVY